MAHGRIEKEPLREIVQGDEGSEVIRGKTTYQSLVISCHYNEVIDIVCALVNDSGHLGCNGHLLFYCCGLIH